MSLNDSLLVKALRGEKVERSPVWFMRQAGRYLPEYREIRAKHSMLDVIRTPELVKTVTMQPIDRFGFDAAIIFADILNPLMGMGIDLDFIVGEGPKIFNPIKNSADVDRLTVPAPEENVGYTLEAIKLCVAELSPCGVPLIGFSGAPLTLALYLMEGEDTEVKGENLLKFIVVQPEAFFKLQEKLSQLVADYLIAQAKAGASALQIFDSWASVLSAQQFKDLAMPFLLKIVSKIKTSVDVPVIYFATNNHQHFPVLSALPVDAFGVDWRINLLEADQLLGKGKFSLQGNLDPHLLISDLDGALVQSKKILLDAKKLRGHVFNLGHGITPEAKIPHVSEVVSFVKALIG